MKQMSQTLSKTLKKFNPKTGTKHSPETIRKMSEKRKLFWSNPDHIEHQSQIAYSRKRKNGAFAKEVNKKCGLDGKKKN